MYAVSSLFFLRNRKARHLTKISHKEMLLGRYLRTQAPYLAHRSMYSSVRVTCPAKIGDKLHAVETPALVVRRDALHRNLQRMKDYIWSLDRPVLLRPHTKTHKCPTLAKLQIEEYGAVGVCCQKLDEAEPMVESGVLDILMTNSFVGEKKIDRLCQLAKKGVLFALAAYTVSLFCDTCCLDSQHIGRG